MAAPMHALFSRCQRASFPELAAFLSTVAPSNRHRRSRTVVGLLGSTAAWSCCLARRPSIWTCSADRHNSHVVGHRVYVSGGLSGAYHVCPRDRKHRGTTDRSAGTRPRARFAVVPVKASRRTPLGSSASVPPPLGRSSTMPPGRSRCCSTRKATSGAWSVEGRSQGTPSLDQAGADPPRRRSSQPGRHRSGPKEFQPTRDKTETLP